MTQTEEEEREKEKKNGNDKENGAKSTMIINKSYNYSTISII